MACIADVAVAADVAAAADSDSDIAEGNTVGVHVDAAAWEEVLHEIADTHSYCPYCSCCCCCYSYYSYSHYHSDCNSL